MGDPGIALEEDYTQGLHTDPLVFAVLHGELGSGS